MNLFKERFLGLCLLMFAIVVNGQDHQSVDVYEDFSPAYLLITTMHWNPDINFEAWKKVEQKYFDEITDKNKFILGASVYRHLISPDDSEVIFVTKYNSLGDIEKAVDKTNDLIEKVWSNEEERADFLEKQDGFYTGIHSDEIATSLPYQKDLVTYSKEPLIIYMRRNTVSGEGSGYKEYFDNIIMKNFYIKGYYTHKHRFGSNSMEAVEVAVFENLADFEDAFVENDRLVKEYWEDEVGRKAFFEEFKKIFSGHGDYLYKNIPSLSK